MLFAQTGSEFTAVLYGADTGLDELTVAIIDPVEETTLYGPSGALVDEVDDAAGVYTATLTAPDVPDHGGLLLIVWSDASFGTSVEELRVSVDPVPGTGGVYPNLTEVGAQIFQRTIERGTGSLLGTFTSDTVPTDEQVEKLMVSAWHGVSARVGLSPPSDAVPLIRNVVAIRTAMMVERAYFATQLSTDRSSYNALKVEYDELLEVAVAQVRDLAGGGLVGEGDEGDEYVGVRFSVPDVELTAWDTPL